MELTISQVAAMLDVSPSFVLKEIESGRLLPTVRDGERRIDGEVALGYRAEQRRCTKAALMELTRLSREMGEAL